MCNLLIPLCPFVLHSITASDSSATQNALSGPSTEAKILFSYLSKRPYPSPGNQSSHTNSQLKPLSLPSLKLYKRTEWHTCPCFFNRIAVLHPLPGPSRPTFGCANKYCARCSSAAKLLRPMRRGGPMDRNTRNDPYWNRCVFLGASGVFESDGSEDVCEGNGNRDTVQAQPLQQVRGSYRTEVREYNNHDAREDGHGQSIRDRDEEHHPPQWRDMERAAQKTDTSRTKSRYQADLDSYLNETYGEKRTGEKRR